MLVSLHRIYESFDYSQDLRPVVFGSYKSTLPEPGRNAIYRIAALAKWSVRSAVATIAANPVENFTNSIKNGRMRRPPSRSLLFL